MRINEIFHSLQGEGLHMGLPTVFVRLTGCNLRCRWCDTTYAYDEGEDMALDDVLAAVAAYTTKRVCITGGEPLHQEEATIALARSLVGQGYTVSVETNGSLPVDQLVKSDVEVVMDVKCPSSGADREMRLENIGMLRDTDQLKFVIEDEGDLSHAKTILEGQRPRCAVILSPVGGTVPEWLAGRVLEEGLDVRVLPQLHKLIWGNRRGV